MRLKCCRISERLGGKVASVPLDKNVISELVARNKYPAIKEILKKHYFKNSLK